MHVVIRERGHLVRADYSGGPYIDLTFGSDQYDPSEVINVWDYEKGGPTILATETGVALEVNDWMRTQAEEWPEWYEGYMANHGLRGLSREGVLPREGVPREGVGYARPVCVHCSEVIREGMLIHRYDDGSDGLENYHAHCLSKHRQDLARMEIHKANGFFDPEHGDPRLNWLVDREPVTDLADLAIDMTEAEAFAFKTALVPATNFAGLDDLIKEAADAGLNIRDLTTLYDDHDHDARMGVFCADCTLDRVAADRPATSEEVQHQQAHDEGDVCAECFTPEPTRDWPALTVPLNTILTEAQLDDAKIEDLITRRDNMKTRARRLEGGAEGYRKRASALTDVIDSKVLDERDRDGRGEPDWFVDDRAERDGDR